MNHNEPKKIMIIDDEKGFTQFVKSILEETGLYQVLEVNAGYKAVDIARDFKPDLILLDIIMPTGDGAYIADKLSTDWELKRIPVIFITAAFTQEEASKHDDMTRGRPCLAKPVGLKELIDCIRKHI